MTTLRDLAFPLFDPAPASPRPLGGLGREPERTGRRRVDARAPVVPFDSVAGARVLVDHLSHGPVPRGTFSRLGLRNNAISGLERHAFLLPVVADRAYSERFSRAIARAPSRAQPTGGGSPPRWARLPSSTCAATLTGPHPQPDSPDRPGPRRAPSGLTAAVGPGPPP